MTRSQSSRFEWRGTFTNAEANALHAESFGHSLLTDDWVGQTERHSLGWVCARLDGELVGFVNVAWDGGVHAFLLDTMVRRDFRHQGIGAQLVAEAVAGAKAAGCEWLHVDYAEDLEPFYAACGFTPTKAGLVQL